MDWSLPLTANSLRLPLSADSAFLFADSAFL